MKINFLATLLLASCLLPLASYSQCNLQIIPADTITITCGESINIDMSAYGNSGNQVLNNNFNDGTVGSGWLATPAATFTNPCSPGSPDGTTHIWLGDATPQPRILTTQSFDLSLGGSICFDLRFAVQAEAAPCEGPDEPQEGVYIQYSTDGGGIWNNINYFDPIGGYDPTLTSWQQYCFPIPVGALTPNTQIRWYQDATSGAEYDHWGLDNVSITLNDPSYHYEWTHTSFLGQNPPTVTVTSDSVFTVYYTNGIDDTCTASVVVQTIPPTFTVTSIGDTSLCGSGCVDLNASANILVRPASQPLYENNEFQPLAPFGVPTAIPINVGGLDITTIGAGSISSVCLDVTNIGGDVNTLTVTLSCPGGTTVTLISPGAVSGPSLTNTCFSSAATTNITSGTSPYSGTYLPVSGSMNDFIGCDANGVWTMTISNSAFFSIGIFNSWGITFDIPEISYQGVYEWSPTTGLSDALSLNPTACPQSTTTYTLAVRDSNNCATYTHDVTIATTLMDVTGAETVNPSPGASDGEIDVTLVGGLAPYDYSIDNGLTSQDSSHFTALATGTYPILVTDAGGCSDTLTVVLNEFEPVQIPNIINPNSQEADNKVFMIKGMTEPEVVIYNRWGKRIYKSDAYQNDWDGEKYHEGTYFYHAKDKADGKDYSGFFQLVRF
jgi:gliding motility-associated-like protein